MTIYFFCKIGKTGKLIIFTIVKEARYENIHTRYKLLFLDCKQTHVNGVLQLCTFQILYMLWFPKNNTLRQSKVKSVAIATHLWSDHRLQEGLLGSYYAHVHGWCAVRPYSKIVIFLFCNISLWIILNHQNRCTE